MRALVDVVLGLGPGRVAGQPAGLAQLCEPGGPAGDDLVHVRLVAGVPDDPVPRRVEDPVQRECELDHAEVGPEMAAGPGHLRDEEVPDLAGEPVELGAGQPAQVRGFPDRVQQAHSLLLGRSNPAPLRSAAGSIRGLAPEPVGASAVAITLTVRRSRRPTRRMGRRTRGAAVVSATAPQSARLRILPQGCRPPARASPAGRSYTGAVEFVNAFTSPWLGLPMVAEQAADVIVVGAGPAGSTAAYHLAQAGLDVLVLEKTTFPREKVCGDGLTPRAVHSLIEMGIAHRREGRLDPQHGPAGDRRRAAARAALARARLLAGLRPGPAAARLRRDAGPARREGRRPAARAGHGHRPGARPQPAGSSGCARRAPTDGPATLPAPLVLAADGVSGRLALSLGIAKRDDRPMGVAVRRYYASPRTHDDYLESWLEIWDSPSRTAAGSCCPGTGGSSAWATAPSTSGSASSTRPRRTARPTTAACSPAGSAARPRSGGCARSNATGPIRGAGLPMGFNRTPHYTRGLLLVGDSGGSVNPFNGEGIAYAMESGRAGRRARRAGAGPTGRSAAGAGAGGVPGRAAADLRRLLPARRRVREAHRQPARHARRHPARSAPSAADAVRAQAARQPHRPPRR